MENVDKWGVDIFRIADLTANRPLTVITYTLLQVADINLYDPFLPQDAYSRMHSAVYAISLSVTSRYKRPNGSR